MRDKTEGHASTTTPQKEEIDEVKNHPMYGQALAVLDSKKLLKVQDKHALLKPFRDALPTLLFNRGSLLDACSKIIYFPRQNH